MTVRLAPARVRELGITAQGLNRGAHARATTAQQILDRLGCIQIDSINVVRRSHELVLLARGAEFNDAAAFVDHHRPPDYFEYWAHAASLVPLDLWPHFAFRRRRLAEHGWNGPAVDPAACADVRKRVEDLGAATISDLGGAQGTGWDRSSPYKWAAEWLLATGEIVSVRRRGWKRVYEPASAALPATLLEDEPDEHDSLQYLSERALKAQGVATTSDVADYFRLAAKSVHTALTASPSCVPVEVDGWREQAWAWAPALDAPSAEMEDTPLPLSPFDSLLWHRPRMRQLFDVDYLLEAYKPAVKRQCGYFGMPVLAAGRIAGRIAVRVDKQRRLTIEGVQIAAVSEPDTLAHALRTAAIWGGADVDAETTRAVLAQGWETRHDEEVVTA